MISALLASTVEQGLIYALAVFGIAMSFRVMNFPDLTVDGSFTLGGAVAGILILHGQSPWISTAAAIGAGFAAGCVTAGLNRLLGISKILSGILVMLMLYSVNLRVMGRANLSLLRAETVFSPLDRTHAHGSIRILILAVACGLVAFSLAYLFSTRLGLHLRATGDNELMVRCRGVNTAPPIFVGLGLANALVALCGAVVAQQQGFADVNMGIGFVIVGFAALIVGEAAVAAFVNVIARAPAGPMRLLPWDSIGELIAAAAGACLYFLAIGVCLRLGLAPTDLRLATSILVILGIAARLRGPLVETHLRGRW